MHDSKLRTILFGTFICIFLATAAITLGSLVGWFSIEPDYKKLLFTSLILEVIACIMMTWRQLNSGVREPPDVAGEWTYECTRGNEYQHGGTCSISIRKGDHGWEFRIIGKRTWTATFRDGSWVRTPLPAFFHWENTWGTFTDGTALRYGYSINLGEKLVQGFGSATIQKDPHTGVPAVLEGNFFQLPPHDPFYGTQRYLRVEEPDDRQAKSKRALKDKRLVS